MHFCEQPLLWRVSKHMSLHYAFLWATIIVESQQAHEFAVCIMVSNHYCGESASTRVCSMHYCEQPLLWRVSKHISLAVYIFALKKWASAYVFVQSSTSCMYAAMQPTGWRSITIVSIVAIVYKTNEPFTNWSVVITACVCVCVCVSLTVVSQTNRWLQLFSPVLIHAPRPYLCTISLFMHHVLIHAPCPYSCTISLFMHHGHCPPM